MASALKETYRVKKISIRRGWAIDQIKFEYDDDKTWSVGIDGGRKDNREFIMTPESVDSALNNNAAEENTLMQPSHLPGNIQFQIKGHLDSIAYCLDHPLTGSSKC